MNRVLFCLLACALAFGLCGPGCMRAGPDYARPEPDFDMPGGFVSGSPEQAAVETDQNRWWEAFDDPALNRAVMRVIFANPDIARAAARVMEARAAVTQTGADQYPSLDFNASRSRQQQNIVEPFSGQRVSVETDTFSLSLPASFELDLWGRLARASEAARADLLAAEQNRRTMVQSMVAETVNLYLQIRSIQEQIDLSRDLVAAYEQNRDLVERRYERGLVSVLDVHQVRRSLARARSQLPALIRARGRAGHALAILQGQYPDSENLKRTTADGLPQLPPVPAALPSQLLDRRPDIRAAEAALEAACARIGAARAARLPQISLTGSFGYTSDAFDTLLNPASQLWQIAAGAFQPVFDAGRRAAAEQGALARYQQQEAVYAKTVLEALAEVEDALLSRQQLIEQHSRLRSLVSEAEATLNSAENRYQRGLVSYINVLDARQASFQAQLDLVEAQYAIFRNRVELHRVLGGGWDQVELNK
ncbi:MAG: efflux transporter outer membrane subunit [Desulfobacterales bacterium]|nr:efflux transporter outer membrane subunit [Desulfobacterales bacterium]